MECTQRLECTQDLYASQSEKLCPEQIGFLGICGKKYPVKKGPNKIGRDPQTCSIVLNLNSVSRQHAVINILNKKDFMLMDLDSANKTKLMGRTLQPYMPQPLQNGDTVQFGEIFGDFRLLEEDNDLPMTQALVIPDTPISTKHMSRMNIGTTVPESPDVSDKEDSFIVPSQPKGAYQSPKTRNFMKPGRTISIQPIGSNKIDNIYWNSSKKSTSLNLDGSNTSLDDSPPIVNSNNKENKLSNNIHELETQMPPGHKLNDSRDSNYTTNTQLTNCEAGPSISTANTQLPSDIYSENTQVAGAGDIDSIHTATTQMPSAMSSPSIHTMDTQLPCGGSPSIHTLNTQLPPEIGSSAIHNIDTQMPNKKLPQVCKINEQVDMQSDLRPNKRNDSIFNAETQLCNRKENITSKSHSKSRSPSSVKSDKLDISDEELLFDDVDQPYEEVQESQAILTEDIDLPINRLVEPEPDFEILTQIPVPKSAKRNMRIDSDSSADCADFEMLPTQKLTVVKVGDDDVTDCEEDDNMIELKIDKNAIRKDIDLVINNEVLPLQGRSQTSDDVDFEDMPTQVLDEVDNIENNTIKSKANLNDDVDFEDLPTQVLQEDVPIKKTAMHIKSFMAEEENSPFKIPCNSPLKAKRVSKTPKIKPIRFYQDTQDIIDDLCTQKLDTSENKNEGNFDNEKLSNKLILDTSVEMDSSENFDKNMSSKEVLKVIGVDLEVTPIARVPSDGSTASDSEYTPKKMRHFNIAVSLPDSQEIKTDMSLKSKTIHAESMSDSEMENSQDQNTPVVFRKKSKPKPNIKLDLTAKFDVEALPSRIITRVRKPTGKLQEAQINKSGSILKPNFLSDQEEMDVNAIDLINENISKLKTEKNKKADQSRIEVNKTDVGIAESVKRARSSKKNNTVAIQSKTKSEKPNDSEAKSKEKRKREPRNTKMQQQDSKNQSTLSNTSTNQSYNVVERNESISASNNSNVNNRLDSTKTLADTKRTRSTRNVKTSKTSEHSGALDSEDQSEKPKRKYTRKATTTETKKVEVKTKKPNIVNKEIIKSTKREDKNEEPTKSPEQEIRRSKRQRAVKEDKKSILKNASKIHEESAVYNMSSSSNSDTSRSFKRPPLDDSDVPSPKRTKSVAATSGRVTPAVSTKTQYVLFTAYPFDMVKTKLENMGAVVVSDLVQSTVVLTKQIKRTFKLLCAVGLGKPIVGPSWVQACTHANTIVDPWQHLIKDEGAEKRFHFNLEKTLRGKRNFLKGYNVSSTPKVTPDATEMKLIVEYSGGTWREGGSQWICVSVPPDSALWPALRARGATIVSTEFILGGVLRQRPDVDVNTFKW